MANPIAASIIPAQAFRFMEMGDFSSFADDSDHAAAAAEQYPVALRMCLEFCDWSFARVRASLAQVSEASVPLPPDPRLPYAYGLPSDMVRLHEIEPENSSWRRDAEYIWSDTTGGITARYCKLIENEAALPATFQIAVAYQLAALLAPMWQQSRAKIADINAGLGEHLQLAKRQDQPFASGARYDGTASQPDWLCEAQR